MKAACREAHDDSGDALARFEGLRAACGRAAAARGGVSCRDAGGGLVLEVEREGDHAVLHLAPGSPSAWLFRRWRGDSGAEMRDLTVDLARGYCLLGATFASAEGAAEALLQRLLELLDEPPTR